MNKQVLATLVGFALPAAVTAATPSLEEMWAIVQQQQSEIATLKSQLEIAETRLSETEIKTSATLAAVEEIDAGPAGALDSWVQKTKIGAYGEMHYNNLDRSNPAVDKDELDLHRFVLFFGHQYGEDLRFFSELEVEHSIAGDGKVGEVELEQAFIEWDFAAAHTAKAGVFLLPVGILNETHEPNTFYGVERNGVESNIVPATWWEGGVAVNGELAGGLNYDLAVHSGLFLDPAKSEFKIRDGRQKVGKAKADEFAYTGRIKYTAVPGLELAATLQYQSDLFQGENLGNVEDISATLYEAHAAIQRGSFGLRALWAQWDIDDAIDRVKDGASEQKGFYIEPSYKLTEKLGVFARYSEWDNQAGSSTESEIEQFDLGLNYWLSEYVVLKLDYQNQDVENGQGDDGFNLGLGWSF